MVCEEGQTFQTTRLHSH